MRKLLLTLAFALVAATPTPAHANRCKAHCKDVYRACKAQCRLGDMNTEYQCVKACEVQDHQCKGNC